MNHETPRSYIKPESARKSLWLSTLLMMTLTAFVYAHVCGQAFVDWDDPGHLYENPLMAPVSAHHLAQYWLRPYEGEYVPVTYMVYSALACIGRFSAPVSTPSGGTTVLNPHVFHAASLALHLLNVLLVFLLLRRIVKRDLAAFAGALFFAVNPVQVEAVAWISELRGLLSAFFGIIALTLYFDYATAQQAGAPAHVVRRIYVFAALACALALLSKASAAAIPLLALVIDVGIVKRGFVTALKPSAAWLLMAVPIFCLTRGAQVIPPQLLVPLWQRPLVAVDAIAFYLSKVLIPMHLGIDYGRTPASVLHSPSALYTWLAPVLLTALVWKLRRKIPFLPAALGLFLAALLPVLGFAPFLFQTFSTVADRYLYLALLGPAFAIAAALAQTKRRAYLAATGVFLIACIFLSRAQVTVWNNSQTLFQHAIAVNPGSAPMHYNLGNAYGFEGRLLDAIAEYQAAIDIRPRFASAHGNLGQSLAIAGDVSDAIVQLDEAIRLAPDLPQAHHLLGLLLAGRGDILGAVRELKTTLQLTPNDINARYSLACALWHLNRLSEAQTQFKTILQHDPGFTQAQQALNDIARAKA